MTVYATKSNEVFDAFWFALPRVGKMPTLADFLDRPNVGIQARVAMTEVFSDTEIRYRLLGTELVEGYGAERTGQNILEVAAPEMRPALVAFFRRIIEEPCGARAFIDAATSKDRNFVFETVCFPLARTRGAPVIVGCNEALDPLALDEHVIGFKTMRDVEWIAL